MFGKGNVVYSTIPLDFYLTGAGSANVVANMKRYATNIAQYIGTLDIAAPLANAGTDLTVESGQNVTLSGAGQSAGNLALSFKWTQSAGPTVTLSNPTAQNPSFVAPSLAEAAVLSFKLVVTDNRGVQSEPDFVDVFVKKANKAPLADAGDSSPVREGASKSLNGENSFDPDNDPITFNWTQTGGTSVVINGANTATPSFVAPIGMQTLTFSLVVSDGKLSSQPAVINIPITANNTPVADAGLSQSGNENTIVTLNGSGSTDPDNDKLSYSWQQISGPIVTLNNANTVAPSFTAPWVNAGQALQFRLTVTDDHCSIQYFQH